MALKNNRVIRSLASFKLAIFSLSAMGVIVFAMTLAQVKMGIFAAKSLYFNAWFLWADIGTFKLPYFLGGKTIGILLLINLLAATFRMPFTRKKMGLWLIHVSVIVLLAGSGWISVVSNESQMAIEEGQTSWYSESMHEIELVLLSDAEGGKDRVVAIPESYLRAGTTLLLTPHLAVSGQTPSVNLEILRVYPNSKIDMVMPGMAVPEDALKATQGIGPQLHVQEQPVVTRDDYRNITSLWVRLRQGEQDLGVWLLSNGIGAEQRIQLGDSTYRLQLRALRYYNDYGIHLQDFMRESHPGTTIPSLFSSRVTAVDEKGDRLQAALIEMNHPLRFRGKTYFQASYGKNDTMTVLQVVENPGWLLPYVSCLGMLLGMLVHFGGMLMKKKKAILTVFCLLGFLGGPIYAKQDLSAAAGIPVVHQGRIKPLDTVARATLLALNEKQTVKLQDGSRLPALDWLFYVMYRPASANALPVFRIQNHTVLGIFGKQGEENIAMSFLEIEPYLTVIEEEAGKASEVEVPNRTTFQREIVRLHRKLVLYQQLKNTVSVESFPNFNQEAKAYLTHLDIFRPLAASHTVSAGAVQSQELTQLLLYFRLFRFMGENAGFLLVDTGKPLSFGDHALDLLNAPERAPYLQAWVSLQSAYLTQDAVSFRAASDRISSPAAFSATQRIKVQLEVVLNRTSPLVWAMVAYVLVMVCAALSWGFESPWFYRILQTSLISGAIVQTTAIMLRMWLSGRPPVTNLYTSAVFVGWVAVFLSIFLERRYRTGVSAFVGGAVGFCTLIIAHHLALQGDTLEMMQAVLDSNFWLATHVVTICIGYGATFFAGALGVVYILRGVLTRGLSEQVRKQLTAMVYGTVCFALLFSFVGTVLGGIWADQSWGRFWGWDPKENGALLIVIWNAVILHTRMGGYIRERGLMLMVVFGNIITAFSWFGVNLLGIGLHSYGFMEKGFVWLSVFIFTQLLVMWLGSLPLPYWRSLKKDL